MSSLTAPAPRVKTAPSRRPRLSSEARDLAALLARWSALADEFEDLWADTPAAVLACVCSAASSRTKTLEFVEDVQLYLSRDLASAVVGRNVG